jgi:uncharacterized membrane-anchored protein
VAALPGEVVVATHAAVLPAGGEPVDPDAVSARFFSGRTLIGAAVAGAAVALTDFRIHRDGFGRLLVLDRGMTRGQAGRTVQRLPEIDTYRMRPCSRCPWRASFRRSSPATSASSPRSPPC